MKTRNGFSLDVYATTNPLVIANNIFETGFVKYCHPTFIVNVILHNTIPTDPYFENQFYLHNTGQEINGKFGTFDADIDAPEAWDITMGDPSIKIAVIDEGVTYGHPDIPIDRIDLIEGSNFHDGDDWGNTQPFPHNNGNHGNAVAGIIAATANNEGIAGIAPECKIMPIKPDFASNSVTNIADAIAYAALNSESEGQADIITNSWGYPDQEFPPPPPAYLTDAIGTVLLAGVPVIFSTGNNGTGYNYVAYPANLDEEDFISAYPGMDIIAVGASDRNDLKATYSPVDTEVDICAPSNTASYCYDNGEGGNIWTLDIPGLNGYNPWHDISPENCDNALIGQEIPSSGNNYLAYTGRMGGTSASAPQVAGVIALMKSLDVSTDCLTVPQINDIIKLSADRVGGYNYHWSQDRPGHSKELGYGKLNAYNALLMTQEFITTGKDLFIKDYTYDIGIEPDFDPLLIPSLPSLTDFQYDDTSRLAINIFDSPDIWARNQPDGIDNQTSEEIEYEEGQPAYIYVKVRTKGCENSGGLGEVTLYWSKSATIQTFPEYWDGSMTNPLMGDYIGAELITADLNSPFIPFQILEFERIPEDPANYTQALGFSFLAIIQNPGDQVSVPSSETGNILQYVTLNNNIACKNVSIIDAGLPFPDILTQGSSLMVNNPYDEIQTYELYFRNSVPIESNSLLKEAEVTLTLDDALWGIWETGGFENENIIICDDENHIVMIDDEHVASFKNFELGINETGYITTKINFLTKEVSNRERYDLFIVQKIAATQEIVGGSKIIVKKPPRPSFTANAGNNIEVSKNEPTILNSNDINENATYNWYDEEGNLVFTGADYLLNPEVTKTYKLEIIAESDGYKDYDNVTVSIKLPEITSLSPNPASQSTDIIINYSSENANSLYLVVMPLNGSFNDNFTLDSNLSQITIPTNNYTTGLYFMSLVADGQVVDQKTFIIN